MRLGWQDPTFPLWGPETSLFLRLAHPGFEFCWGPACPVSSGPGRGFWEVALPDTRPCHPHAQPGGVPAPARALSSLPTLRQPGCCHWLPSFNVLRALPPTCPTERLLAFCLAPQLPCPKHCMGQNPSRSESEMETSPPRRGSWPWDACCGSPTRSPLLTGLCQRRTPPGCLLPTLGEAHQLRHAFSSRSESLAPQKCVGV